MIQNKLKQNNIKEKFEDEQLMQIAYKLGYFVYIIEIMEIDKKMNDNMVILRNCFNNNATISQCINTTRFKLNKLDVLAGCLISSYTIREIYKFIETRTKYSIEEIYNTVKSNGIKKKDIIYALYQLEELTLK